jgi:putative transposase
MITAACYEHQHVIGASETRMLDFEQKLVETASAHSIELFAWNVLPNHYHLLLATLGREAVAVELGRLHGRTSFDLERRGRSAQTQGLVQCGGNGHEVRGAFLGVVELCVAQRRPPRLCRTLARLAVLQRRAVFGASRTRVALRRWRAYPLYDYGQDWDRPDF